MFLVPHRLTPGPRLSSSHARLGPCSSCIPRCLPLPAPLRVCPGPVPSRMARRRDVALGRLALASRAGRQSLRCRKLGSGLNVRTLNAWRWGRAAPRPSWSWARRGCAHPASVDAASVPAVQVTVGPDVLYVGSCALPARAPRCGPGHGSRESVTLCAPEKRSAKHSEPRSSARSGREALRLEILEIQGVESARRTYCSLGVSLELEGCRRYAGRVPADGAGGGRSNGCGDTWPRHLGAIHFSRTNVTAVTAVTECQDSCR